MAGFLESRNPFLHVISRASSGAGLAASDMMQVHHINATLDADWRAGVAGFGVLAAVLARTSQ